jgi:hypothetical protein
MLLLALFFHGRKTKRYAAHLEAGTNMEPEYRVILHPHCANRQDHCWASLVLAFAGVTTNFRTAFAWRGARMVYLNTVRSQHLKGIGVHSGFGQPDSFRVTPKTLFKIMDSPANLCHLVPALHSGMIRWLCTWAMAEPCPPNNSDCVYPPE